MNVYDSRRPLATGTCDDVRVASESTVISNLYRASRNAGDVGNLVDCTNLAHVVFKGGRRDLDSAAYALETELLDLALLQKVTSPEDAIILAVVGAQRAMGLEDRVDKEDRPMCSSIAEAMMNLAGWVCQQHGRQIIQQLPEPLREDATEYLDNYVGVAGAPEA